MLPIKIRPMKIKDLEVVLEIERVSFSSPWTKNMFLSDLQNKSSHLRVALGEPRSKLQRGEERKIVGYSAFWFISGEVHITNLAVHPQFRRQKIGERLLIDLLKEAKLRRIKRALLEARVSNLPAQGLYKKFGFREVSIHKSYYSDTGEDALVMCKNLEEVRCLSEKNL
jgi:ribosomal-protein-alanine N-acetyltransferase